MGPKAGAQKIATDITRGSGRMVTCDALVGDFLFELLDGRDVPVDDRLVEQRP